MNISGITNSYISNNKENFIKVDKIDKKNFDNKPINENYKKLLLSFSPELKSNLHKINYIEEAVDTLNTIKTQIKENISICLNIHKSSENAKELLSEV